MKRYSRAIAAICGLALTASSFAWNDTGHMIIAAIAEGRLNKKAWDECDRLIKIGGTETTKGFIAGSVWADETRTQANGPWHYINHGFRPDGKKSGVSPAEENVVWAIERFSNILKDRSKPDAERADALRYLIHFVGDVHQPLHAVAMEDDAHPKGDRGGNDYPIKAAELFPGMENPPANLHALWDMGVGAFMPGIEKRPLAADGEGRVRIMAQNFASRYPISLFKDQPKNLNPADWALESFGMARDSAYKVRTGGEIDLTYAGVGKSMASARAVLAGYRLAALLNKLVG